MMSKLHELATELEGDFFTDETIRTLYATDASAYREMPLAVAIPASVNDIKKLIAFANRQKTSLIPRTAGTSLAGQVVGNGIVVDVSKNFTQILEYVGARDIELAAKSLIGTVRRLEYEGLLGAEEFTREKVAHALLHQIRAVLAV